MKWALLAVVVVVVLYAIHKFRHNSRVHQQISSDERRIRELAEENKKCAVRLLKRNKTQ